MLFVLYCLAFLNRVPHGYKFRNSNVFVFKNECCKNDNKKCLDVSDFNITDSYFFLLLELPGKWMS